MTKTQWTYYVTYNWIGSSIGAQVVRTDKPIESDIDLNKIARGIAMPCIDDFPIILGWQPIKSMMNKEYLFVSLEGGPSDNKKE